jgi:hypothetical protein
MCKEPIEKHEASTSLACQHVCHFKCAKRWKKQTCPLCRMSYGGSETLDGILFKCEMCDFSVNALPKLLSHYRQDHHSEHCYPEVRMHVLSKYGSDVIACEFCLDIFMNNGLKAHSNRCYSRRETV